AARSTAAFPARWSANPPTVVTGSSATHFLCPLDTPSKTTVPPAAAKIKPTLLIVDDEEGPRQSLRIVFKDDYTILLADSGEKALELARQQRIDAAVLDIRMAGMSGTEVLDQLKGIDP